MWLHSSPPADLGYSVSVYIAICRRNLYSPVAASAAAEEMRSRSGRWSLVVGHRRLVLGHWREPRDLHLLRRRHGGSTGLQAGEQTDFPPSRFGASHSVRSTLVQGETFSLEISLISCNSSDSAQPQASGKRRFNRKDGLWIHDCLRSRVGRPASGL